MQLFLECNDKGLRFTAICMTFLPIECDLGKVKEESCGNDGLDVGEMSRKEHAVTDIFMAKEKQKKKDKVRGLKCTFSFVAFRLTIRTLAT
jgi:hypothetical protein